ncbi:MAG: response regulator transcription factor [Chloroflexi bacterium]|nr:response regulator transcription factor [Chloroflexota bacterium]
MVGAQTRLIILAPAALHREAWRALLNQQHNIAVMGAVSDLGEITPLLLPKQATTILIDQPEQEPTLVRTMRRLAPECGLLFLVHSYNLDEVIELLRAGATGCISRQSSVGDLARAIIAAGRGEIVLPSEIAARALAALARGEGRGNPSPMPLSDRETEVLHHLAQGRTNKDIAQTLFLSVRTVESHLRGIYRKLDVGSRTEAVLWAAGHGYQTDD